MVSDLISEVNMCMHFVPLLSAAASEQRWQRYTPATSAALFIISLGMDHGMLSGFIMIKNFFLLCVSMNLASHFG